MPRLKNRGKSGMMTPFKISRFKLLTSQGLSCNSDYTINISSGYSMSVRNNPFAGADFPALPRSFA
jgi:hypothetical protein